MPNLKLAHVAQNAVYGGAEYPTKARNCQMFVRECLEAAHGEAVSERVRAGTAKNAALLWKNLGWGFNASELKKQGGLQEGDCLYKTQGSGGFGHVGIAVRQNNKWLVAENSSTALGRVRGALGFRTLAQFGNFQVVGRLPESILQPRPPSPQPPPPEAKLVLVTKDDAGSLLYHRLQSATHGDGHFYADKGEVLAALFGGEGRVPVAEFLKKLGAGEFALPGNHLDDPAEPRMYLFVETKG